MSTVVNEVTPFAQYEASAGADTFQYTWWIREETDLKVYVDGELVATTDYTVSGTQTSTGGNVVFDTPLTGGEIVTISTDYPFERLSGFATSGSLRAAALNLELSYLVACILQLQRDQQRSLKLSATSDLTPDLLVLPEAEDGKVLAWDGTSGALQNGPTIDDIENAGGYATAAAASAAAAAASATAIPSASVITATGSSKSRSLAERFAEAVNVRDFISDYSDSTTHPAGFNAAIIYAAAQNRPVFVPPGLYRVHDIDLLAGITLFGYPLRHRATDGVDLIEADTQIKLTSGQLTMFNLPTVLGGITLTNLELLGNAKAAGSHAFNLAGDIEGFNVTHCSIRAFYDMYGGDTSAYVKSGDFYGNRISGNGGNGLINPVDCLITANRFTDNGGDDIYGSAGSNSNRIYGNRHEFGDGYAVRILNSDDNIIDAYEIDRKAKQAIYITGGTTTIGKGWLRRNAELNASTEDSHLRFDGGAKIYGLAPMTKVGQDDGGGGTITPKYVVRFGSSVDYCEFIGGDGTGFTSAFSIGTQPTSYRRDIGGVSRLDQSSTYGTTYDTDLVTGRHRCFRTSLTAAGSGGSASGSSLATKIVLDNNEQAFRTLVLTARNTVTGEINEARFPVCIYRVAGSAAVIVGTVFGEANGGGGAGFITESAGTGTVKFSISSVAADGSTFTLGITNAHTNQQTVVAVLHPY